jgi:tetratricopeptide (TPR) repeat protein
MNDTVCQDFSVRSVHPLDGRLAPPFCAIHMRGAGERPSGNRIPLRTSFIHHEHVLRGFQIGINMRPFSFHTGGQRPFKTRSHTVRCTSYVASWAMGVVLCLVLFSGCATPQPSLEISEADARADLARLEQELAQHPEDVEVKRDLGTLYVLVGRSREGQRLLVDAYEADSDDPKTLFYLGLASERLDRLDQALQLYERYGDIDASSPYRAALQGRYDLVLRDLARRQARQQVAQCLERGQCSSASPSTVAVLPLVYQGGNERFAPIGRGLAELISIDLANVAALTVVERVRLQAVLDEIGRSQTGSFDPNVGPETGQLLGAGQVVNGAFTVQNDERVDLRALLSSVDSSSRDLESGSAEINRLFELQQAVVRQTLEALGVRVRPEVEERIQTPATQSFEAFLAFSRGLDAEDRRAYREAAGHYQRAQQIDPAFRVAAVRASQASALSQASTGVLPTPVLTSSIDMTRLRLSNMPTAGTLTAPGTERDRPDGEWSTVGAVPLEPLPLPPPPTTGDGGAQ